MSEMRLTDTLVEWLVGAEWEERPEIDDENLTSSTEFKYRLDNDLSVKGFFEIVEKAGFFKLYMYFFDTKVPAAKLDEVIKYVNLVNIQTPVGSLIISPSERVIRFYTAIDFEDAAFELKHISNVLSAGLRTMELRLPQYMAICFGGKTAEEALEIEPE
jgi:hypothetical protein